MNVPSALKYLVPRGAWLRRTVLLFSFVLFDYFVTLTLCTTPYAEGNLLARSFMETYGIAAGLTLFDLLLGLPIYAILCIDSHFIKYTKQYSTKAELSIDLALGWVIAGAHFNGAASWLWDAPHLIRQTMGFIIYVAIAFASLYPAPKLALPTRLLKLGLNKKE